jgi:hypothetical protein
MHAYQAPGPRAVARTATVLHVIKNTSGRALSIDVDEWHPSHGIASLDSLRADLDIGGSCTFAACAGADLVMNLGGARHQLKAPGGGVPLVWWPGDGLRTAGLKELATKGLPQWLLETDITNPNSGQDALSRIEVDIPSALRRAGASEQARMWEEATPIGCEEGPCTVFAVVDGAPALQNPSLLALPGVTLFFDGLNHSGSEATSCGGLCRYAVAGNVLNVSSRRDSIRVDGLADSRRQPLRTLDRHRVVHALTSS